MEIKFLDSQKLDTGEKLTNAIYCEREGSGQQKGPDACNRLAPQFGAAFKIVASHLQSNTPLRPLI